MQFQIPKTFYTLPKIYETTWDLRISRSLPNASAVTSSFVRNNGFAATICIAISDPTRWTASSEASLSSTSSDNSAAIRPTPELQLKAKTINSQILQHNNNAIKKSEKMHYQFLTCER